MEEKSTSHQNTEVHNSIKSLEELCLIHGDDPTLHIRLAELLYASGREIAALVTARKAYQVLRNENPSEAKALAKRFGTEVMVDEKDPLASNVYSPLGDIFSKFRFNRHKQTLVEGEVLYCKGDAADSIYLILEGELAVNAEVDGVHSLINYLYVGSLIGRNVQRKAGVHSSTVVAIKNSILLRFTKEELEKAFLKHHDLQIQFAKESLLRRRVELLSAVSLFSRMPVGLRFLIASRSWNTLYKAGDTIKGAKENMPHAELIVGGVVHLYDAHGEKLIYCGRVSVGEMLGLYKLMHQQALSLFIKAETDCEVLSISFTDIEDLMDIQPALRKKLTDASVASSQQITRTILLQKDIKE